jgi:hypothetical protein
MGKGLRRAGWALLTAGSLVVTGPAVAQKLRPVATHSCRQDCSAGCESAPLDPEQARAQEVSAELAWLADSATFSCSLVARVQDGVLRLRGFVPNELVRRRAVMLAQTHTGLPVVDAIQICPDMAVRRGGGRPEDLQTGAALLLREAFPGDAETFQIQAAADGAVAVAGTVTSREDQLGVSRWLRRLPGCSCVLNQLEVAPAGVAYMTPEAPTAPPLAPARPGVRHTSYEPLSRAGGDAPHVAEGVSFFPGEDRPVYPSAWPFVTPPPPPPSDAVLALKRRIEMICGRAVRDVQIVPQSGNAVQIRFTLRNRSKGDEIYSKIMAMPELEAYHISFEMQADP